MRDPSRSAAFVRTDFAETFSFALLLLLPSGIDRRMDKIGGSS